MKKASDNAHPICVCSCLLRPKMLLSASRLQLNWIWVEGHLQGIIKWAHSTSQLANPVLLRVLFLKVGTVSITAYSRVWVTSLGFRVFLRVFSTDDSHYKWNTILHQKCNQQMVLRIPPRKNKGAWIEHPNQLLICNAYLVTNTKPTAKFIHPIHMK